MGDLDTLLTFAEIAVTFLGFSGVVAVFIRKEEDLWVKGTIYRMRLMLEVSIAALVFSLLPVALTALALGQDYLWLLMNGLLLLYFLVVTVIYSKRTKEQLKIETETINPFIKWFFNLMVPAFVFGLGLALAGVWKVSLPGLHTAAIIFMLVSAALYFFRMLFFIHEQTGSKKKPSKKKKA